MIAVRDPTSFLVVSLGFLRFIFLQIQQSHNPWMCSRIAHFRGSELHALRQNSCTSALNHLLRQITSKTSLSVYL